MDALKKFLNKKKTDKTDKKFKNAGPGHRLTDNTAANVTASATSSAGGGARKASPTPTQRVGPTEERKAAVDAALARLEQKKSTTNPNEMLANRQLKFIREQARKEIEAEKRREEAGKEEEAHPARTEESSAGAGHGSDVYTMRAENGHVVDPEHYAVRGIFYTCPIVGPAVGTRAEIESEILSFLKTQLQVDMGVTSSLMILSCNPREKVQTCVDTLCKYLDNIINHPSETKYRKIRSSNRVFQERVASVYGALEFLEAAGFTKTFLKATEDAAEEEEFLVYSPPPGEQENEEGAVAALTELRDSLHSTTPIRPELDRNVQVLMPAQVTTRRELPPDFYQLSGHELQREQQRRTEIAEKELQLRTRAQRERDELRDQRLYKFCLMRIRFPDGFTLQGTFRSTEKLGDVYAFVQESLAFGEAVFSLKRPGGGGGETLSDLDATLAELKLPPASILNFKLESDLPHDTELSYLTPDLLALVQPMQ